jgi:hypothetical protein
MGMPFEWDQRLFSIDTAEFDRVLHQLRRDRLAEAREPGRIRELAGRLKDQPGIPRREFDRRFRLIISTLFNDDPTELQTIAGHLREDSHEALNAIRTLLPAELRHVAIPPPAAPLGPSSSTVRASPATPSEPTAPARVVDPHHISEHAAVALIGTTEEHVRNEGLLRTHNLDPFRLQTLEQLWEIAPTGLCGFVVGGSAWRQVPASEHPRAIRLICEYSTFLFSRTCVDGLSEDAARSFTQQATDARCGPLNGQKFCHGQDCELSLSDISALLDAARLLEAAGTVDFFPLGLSESDAALLRLIAEERRPPRRPVTIRRLGTRELAGGRSGARVFLLDDGSSQPFVAKVGDPEELGLEVRRYQDWIAQWETSVTSPNFHAHSGSAAITYRLQSAPDAGGHPAPTLEDRLDQLRAAEWNETLEQCERLAYDLYLAVERAVDRLVELNSKHSSQHTPDEEFWLHWPIRDLAERGIEFTLVNKTSQSIGLWNLIQQAVSCVEPNLGRGVVHGDIHGRNILLIDRLPAFIDFARSGPGHPCADLARLDAVVRTSAMRMLLNKRSMHDIFYSVYVTGTAPDSILREYPLVAASPLATLAIRSAAKVRAAAGTVTSAHGLSISDFFAMQCIVSAHILANLSPGSGIERLMLSVLAGEIRPSGG